MNDLLNIAPWVLTSSIALPGDDNTIRLPTPNADIDFLMQQHQNLRFVEGLLSYEKGLLSYLRGRAEADEVAIQLVASRVSLLEQQRLSLTDPQFKPNFNLARVQSAWRVLPALYEHEETFSFEESDIHKASGPKKSIPTVDNFLKLRSARVSNAILGANEGPPRDAYSSVENRGHQRVSDLPDTEANSRWKQVKVYAAVLETLLGSDVPKDKTFYIVYSILVEKLFENDSAPEKFVHPEYLMIGSADRFLNPSTHEYSHLAIKVLNLLHEMFTRLSDEIINLRSSDPEARSPNEFVLRIMTREIENLAKQVEGEQESLERVTDFPFEQQATTAKPGFEQPFRRFRSEFKSWRAYINLLQDQMAESPEAARRVKWTALNLQDAELGLRSSAGIPFEKLGQYSHLNVVLGKSRQNGHFEVHCWADAISFLAWDITRRSTAGETVDLQDSSTLLRWINQLKIASQKAGIGPERVGKESQDGAEEKQFLVDRLGEASNTLKTFFDGKAHVPSHLSKSLSAIQRLQSRLAQEEAILNGRLPSEEYLRVPGTAQAQAAHGLRLVGSESQRDLSVARIRIARLAESLKSDQLTSNQKSLLVRQLTSLMFEVNDALQGLGSGFETFPRHEPNRSPMHNDPALAEMRIDYSDPRYERRFNFNNPLHRTQLRERPDLPALLQIELNAKALAQLLEIEEGLLFRVNEILLGEGSGPDGQMSPSEVRSYTGGVSREQLNYYKSLVQVRVRKLRERIERLEQVDSQTVLIEAQAGEENLEEEFLGYFSAVRSTHLLEIPLYSAALNALESNAPLAQFIQARLIVIHPRPPGGGSKESGEEQGGERSSGGSMGNVAASGNYSYARHLVLQIDHIYSGSENRFSRLLEKLVEHNRNILSWTEAQIRSELPMQLAQMSLWLDGVFLSEEVLHEQIVMASQQLHESDSAGSNAMMLGAEGGMQGRQSGQAAAKAVYVTEGVPALP